MLARDLRFIRGVLLARQRELLNRSLNQLASLDHSLAELLAELVLVCHLLAVLHDHTITQYIEFVVYGGEDFLQLELQPFEIFCNEGVEGCLDAVMDFSPDATHPADLVLEGVCTLLNNAFPFDSADSVIHRRHGFRYECVSLQVESLRLNTLDMVKCAWRTKMVGEATGCHAAKLETRSVCA